MSASTEVETISARDLGDLDVLDAGIVQVRRDIYRFVQFVQEKGLTRTKRENSIPKVAARRLAKLLSYDGEAEIVEQDGAGHWSEHISFLAKDLGLVDFDTKGEYVGYYSTEPSYPDNEVLVNETAWSAYLKKDPLESTTATRILMMNRQPALRSNTIVSVD